MSYDFESILQRMKDRLSGRVSAMEGTVTGDILQAVAAELARIWSQEVDTVTQRGFVSTAEGVWLDAACSDYGITRKTGETDEQLRQRVLERIRQRGAGGTAADYVAWATAVEGVTAAYAVELGRGPGTVDVYYSPAEDATGNVTQRLKAHLESLRPVGADVAVWQAQPVTVSVEARITRGGDVSLEDIRRAFAGQLAGYLRQARFTEAGQVVSINRIIGLLMNVEGVADAQTVTLNGQSASLTLEQGAYAVPGEVVLTEVADG